jgi:hypothetical protein
MTITVDIRSEVQAALARQADAHGRALEAYAASLLEDAADVAAETHAPAFDKERARAAGERIRKLRKGVSLGGLTIRELVDEGRP